MCNEDFVFDQHSLGASTAAQWDLSISNYQDIFVRDKEGSRCKKKEVSLKVYSMDRIFCSI